MFKWEGRRNVQNVSLVLNAGKINVKEERSGGGGGESSAEMTLARGLSPGVGRAKPGRLPGQELTGGQSVWNGSRLREERQSGGQRGSDL